MALYMSSIATLIGAIGFNRTHRVAAQQDVGGKIERLISNINSLATIVSALNAAVVSAANSGVSFSAFSTAPTTTPVTMSNFNASNW